MGIWRSIKTTFVLFLIVVPVIVIANVFDTNEAEDVWSDLILPAAGLVIFAAIVAEVGRRMVNFFFGSEICHWQAKP